MLVTPGPNRYANKKAPLCTQSNWADFLWEAVFAAGLIG